ncbi:MAG: DUF3054 domain-containing protein [Lapillicoccus sp.]
MAVPSRRLSSRLPAGVAMALDAAVVLAFAAVGRASHDWGHLPHFVGGPPPPAGETNPVLGALVAAWPFLVGAGVGWVLVRTLSRRWPLDVGAGVSVAACTVVVGMLVRTVTGQGTAPTFVLVATVVLAALLLGWRALVRTLRPA